MEGIYSKKCCLNLKCFGTPWKQPGDFAFVPGTYASQGPKTEAFLHNPIFFFFLMCISKNAGGIKYVEEPLRPHAYEQRPGPFKQQQKQLQFLICSFFLKKNLFYKDHLQVESSNFGLSQAPVCNSKKTQNQTTQPKELNAINTRSLSGCLSFPANARMGGVDTLWTADTNT